MARPPVGVEIVVEVILNIVSNLSRSIIAIVLNIILVVVPLRLVKPVCYILIISELADVIPVFGTVRLKIRQFALILPTPTFPKLLISSCFRRSID